jgi:hypothetical protein
MLTTRPVIRTSSALARVLGRHHLGIAERIDQPRRGIRWLAQRGRTEQQATI